MAYKLPATIYNPSQLRSLQRELKQLKSLRSAQNIVFSENLQELAVTNSVKKLNTKIVSEMLSFIETLIGDAPEVSVSLASSPGSEDRVEFISWMRRKIHPQLMIHFIIRPELLAGCIVRTAKGVHDWSLKTALETNKEKLTKRLINA